MEVSRSTLGTLPSTRIEQRLVLVHVYRSTLHFRRHSSQSHSDTISHRQEITEFADVDYI